MPSLPQGRSQLGLQDQARFSSGWVDLCHHQRMCATLRVITLCWTLDSWWPLTFGSLCDVFWYHESQSSRILRQANSDSLGSMSKYKVSSAIGSYFQHLRGNQRLKQYSRFLESLRLSWPPTRKRASHVCHWGFLLDSLRLLREGTLSAQVEIFHLNYIYIFVFVCADLHVLYIILDKQIIWIKIFMTSSLLFYTPPPSLKGYFYL